LRVKTLDSGFENPDLEFVTVDSGFENPDLGFETFEPEFVTGDSTVLTVNLKAVIFDPKAVANGLPGTPNE
jgi:uncharacterized protein (UPF0212 family)